MPENLHVQEGAALSTSAVGERRDLDVGRQRRVQREEDGSAGSKRLEAVAHHHHHKRPAPSPAGIGVRTLVVGVLKQGSASLQDSGGEGRVSVLAIQL